MNDRCLGVHCCVNLDFKITKLMLKTWFILDPCNLTFSIVFEKVSINHTLFSYTWGKMLYWNISDALAIRFVITEKRQVQLYAFCVWGVCVGVWVCGGCVRVCVFLVVDVYTKKYWNFQKKNDPQRKPTQYLNNLVINYQRC